MIKVDSSAQVILNFVNKLIFFLKEYLDHKTVNKIYIKGRGKC